MQHIWIVVGVVVAFVLLKAQPMFAAKPDARLSNEPQMEHARRVVAQVWSRHGYLATVTSGNDSTHKAESLHYVGLAEDYRTRDVNPAHLPIMVEEVTIALGGDYDVVLESDHLHVEYDPA